MNYIEREADRSSDGAESDGSGSWHQSDHDFVAADDEDDENIDAAMQAVHDEMHGTNGILAQIASKANRRCAKCENPNSHKAHAEWCSKSKSSKVSNKTKSNKTKTIKQKKRQKLTQSAEERQWDDDASTLHEDGSDTGGADKNDQTEILRQLHPIPRVSLGLHPVCRYVPGFFGFAPTPSDVSVLRTLPWYLDDGKCELHEFAMDRSKQAECAVRFARPYRAGLGMRKLASDRLDLGDEPDVTDHCAIVLNAILATHEQTALDNPRTAEYSKVQVHHYNRDRTADSVLRPGPGAGLEGCHTLTLFKTSVASTDSAISSSTDSDILKVATYLAQMFHGCDIPNNTCYSCSTAFTEFKRVKNGNKLYHENVRYNNAVPTEAHVLDPCVGRRSKTVDMQLLQRIAKERCKQHDKDWQPLAKEFLDDNIVIPESRSFARAANANGMQSRGFSLSGAVPVEIVQGAAAGKVAAGVAGGAAGGAASGAAGGADDPGCDAKIMPQSRQTSGVYASSAGTAAQSAFCDEVCQDDFKSGLFDITIWTSYLEGVDERGGRCVVKVETLILKMRVPGSDGCILLDKMRQNVAGSVSSLRCILSHMLSCLNYPQTLDMDKIFSSSVGDMNIAAITEPGQIPVALFNVCCKRHIYNVQWQGMRLDVNNSEEMKLYMELLRHVIKARQLHMSIIGQGIAVEGTPGFRHTKRQKYRERYGYFPQLFEGWHWVWAPLDEVEEKILKSMQHAEEVGNISLYNEIVEQWNDFAKMNIVLQADDGAVARVFWRERGLIPFNCGAFAVINPWGVQRYDKEAEKRRRENPHKDPSLFGGPITSINRVAPLMELYIRNKQETGSNPYAVFWNPEGPVLDKTWMRHNEHQLPVIKELVEAMGEEVTDCGAGTVNGTTLNINDVLVFFGGKSHVLRGAMEDIAVRGELPTLALSTYNLTMHHIRVALNLMENAELKQVSIAAAVVVGDLKQQGMNFASDWLHDAVRFTQYKNIAVEFSGAAEMLNDDNIVGMWRQLHEQAVGHRLTFCNQALLCGIRDACVAHFAFAFSKQYLGAIILADAAYGHIMAKQAFGPPLKRQVTWKNPGSGADSVWNYVGQEAQAYGRHITRRQDLQNEFKSKQMLDQTLSKISSFQLTTVLASGLPTYGDGQIDLSNTNYKLDAYKAFGMTEWAKQFGQNTEVFGAIEQGMAESGTGDGVEKRDWISSHNLNERGSRKTGHGLCNVFLTGNREIPMPQSAFARWQLYASGRWDGDNGVFDREVTDQTECDSKELSAELFITDCYKNILDLTLGKEGRKIATGLIAHYFQIYYTRKPFTMLTNILQIPPKFAIYNLRAKVSVLESAWLNMTSNIVRSYIADKNDASRFLGGAWQSSCMQSNWLRSITIQCIIRNTSILEMQADGKTTLPLSRINEEAVRTLLHCPVTLTCMLSSLHHITSHSSLDVHIMALSCYMLRTMEWYEHCPLHVLALAVQGHSMSSKQSTEYDAFAERLLALVSHKEGESPAPSGNCWLLHHGNMQLPTLKDAQEWCDMGGEDPDVRQRIIDACAVRTNSRMKSKRTHYVRTLQRFIRYEPPNTVNGDNGKKRDSAPVESVEQIASELWAEQQSKAAHIFRKEKRSQPTRFDPSRIWHTIAMGTGIQRGHENQACGQDQHFPKFKAQYETSTYFLDTIQRLGAAQALLRDVVSFLGLPRSCTRLQFVQRILEQYIVERGLRPVWLENEYWLEPVLQTKTHRDMFKWSLLPSVNDIADRQNSTVSGIETFLGMSVEWLVVSQAMYCKEWSVGLQECDASKGDDGMQFAAEEDDADCMPETRDNTVNGSSATHRPHMQDTRPRAVCHLRNMAHCASDIIMMMIHMHIDMAALPVMMLDSDGHKSMRLYTQNALMHSVHKNACIVFDERLHQDTRGARSRCTKLLCLRVRQSHDNKLKHMSLRLLHCPSVMPLTAHEKVDSKLQKLERHGPGIQDSQHMLVYNAVLNDDDGEQKLLLGEFLPVPPESCYHMQTAVGMLQTAHKALVSKYGMQNSLLNQVATAMLVYGQSVAVNIVRFMPINMTEAVAYKEIPCMTWSHGHLFVLRVDNEDRMQVVSVKPTHSVWQACPVMARLQFELNLPSFIALPLYDVQHSVDGNTFSMDKLGLFMSHGLSLSTDEHGATTAKLDINSKYLESNLADKLPACFMPLLQCPQLLWLQRSGRYLIGGDDEMYDIVDTRHEYEAMVQSPFLERVSNDEMLLAFSKAGVVVHADKADNVVAFQRTHGYAVPTGMNNWFIWLDQSAIAGREQQAELLFFVGIAHFKFYAEQLLRNGCVYVTDHCHHNVLLRNAQNSGTYDNTFALYPILHKACNSEDGSTLFLRMDSYDHVGFDSICASILQSETQVKASANNVFQMQCDVDDIIQQIENGSLPRYTDKLDAANAKLHTAKIHHLTKIKQITTLEDRGRACIVKQKVQEVVTLCAWDEQQQMAGPRQPNCAKPTIGMIFPSERHGRLQWLLDGRYNVVFMNGAFSDTIAMDFVTVTCCAVVEGKRLWLAVDATLYALMLKQHPYMQLEQKHAKMLANANHVRYVQAFYVLGDACCVDNFDEQQITVACMCKDIMGNSAPKLYNIPLFNANDMYTSYIEQQPPVSAVLQYHLVSHIAL